MAFNAEQFLKDYNIEHFTSGKNVSVGWIAIRCPLCGDPSNHGGFARRGGFFSCWRCGKHRLPKVISRLLHITQGEARGVMAQYFTGKDREVREKRAPKKRPKEVLLPKGTGPLKKQHLDYLRRRRYDPHELIRTWGLQATGPRAMSRTGVDYKFRIIAPIYLDGQLISYQGRDYTDKQTLKYKACPGAEEVLDHKHSLYGIDLVDGDSVLVVEGITDVWRLGPGSVATFGTEWTREQATLLMKRFRRVALFFDSEPDALASAINLAAQLTFSREARPIEVRIVELREGDPAGLTDGEVREIRREYLENKKPK